MQTLGEDLVLLSIDLRSGRLSNASRLRFGLMGSELVRLAASRRVDITDGRIVVLHGGPTGDPELDAALASRPGGLQRRRPGRGARRLPTPL